MHDAAALQSRLQRTLRGIETGQVFGTDRTAVAQQLVAWLALASVMTWVALERSPEDIDTRLRETARILAEAAAGPEATLPARMLAAQGALLRITGRDLLGVAGLTHTRVLNT